MVLTVATDCTGLGSVFYALTRLNVPWRHVWGSDVEKHCRLMVNLHCRPNWLRRDIFAWDLTDLPRDVDLYIVGFPCQVRFATALPGTPF